MEQNFNRVADGIYQLNVPFFAEGYYTTVTLVAGGTREMTCLIDSGDGPGEVDRTIVPALKALGLSPQDVGNLLCTHSHGDHIRGHIRFWELSKCRTYAYLPPPFFTAAMPVEQLKGDETFSGRLHLLPTPGHCMDAVCWLDERTGTLISGDSFQAGGTAGCGLALFTDKKAYLESIGRVREMPINAVIAGHAFDPFPAIILGKDIDAFFACSARIVQAYATFVQNAVLDGETDAESITLAMIRALGRPCEKYIARGDNTVRCLLQSFAH